MDITLKYFEIMLRNNNKLIFSKVNMASIGVNRPAIVREIPHFVLFPAFPQFCEKVPISGYYSVT